MADALKGKHKGSLLRDITANKAKKQTGRYNLQIATEEEIKRNPSRPQKPLTPLILELLLKKYVQEQTNKKQHIFLDSFLLYTGITKTTFQTLRKNKEFENITEMVLLTCSTYIIQQNFSKLSALLLKTDHNFTERIEQTIDNKVEITINRALVAPRDIINLDLQNQSTETLPAPLNLTQETENDKNVSI
jgi:hypothetical protein